MTTFSGNSRRIGSGILAAALAVLIAAPVEAQGAQRYQSGPRAFSGDHDRRYSGGHRYYNDGHRYYNDGHRYYNGGHRYYYGDGGWFLGALGLGLMVDALVDSQRPVVVYQPQPYYQQYQPPPQGYPPPRRDYPECQQFIGNPGAMAYCEKGVLERLNEEQRLIEQKAYEAGRGQ